MKTCIFLEIRADGLSLVLIISWEDARVLTHVGDFLMGGIAFPVLRVSVRPQKLISEFFLFFLRSFWGGTFGVNFAVIFWAYEIKE